MQVSWRPEPGLLLGETYRLEESLGLTEAGERFRALDLSNQRMVVLTCLHPKLFEGSARGPNALRVQRSRAYVHNNIGATHDIVLSGPHYYVVNEPVAGVPLERWVLGRLPLEREAIKALVGQIVEALECIHLIGVHGNLRPATVVVDEAGRVQLTETWHLAGTAGIELGALLPRQSQWTAPEQRSGSWQERHETDVFLLAALVSWLIAGRAVVPGLSLREQRIEIDAALDALLLRATAPEPEARLQDIRTLWVELQATWKAIEEGQGQEGPVVAEELSPEPTGASPPPLEIVDGLTEGEDEELEQTEAIPLEEIERMGLDAGLSADASHVDAIVILDDDEQTLTGEIFDATELEEIEPVPLVTDTSFIPADALDEGFESVEAIVEVGIIERPPAEESVAASEERTVQVVPGPGSARALEAARLAENRRKDEKSLAALQELKHAAPEPGPPPEPRVRTRAVYVAPFLALIAGGAMFWALSQALDEPPSEPTVNGANATGLLPKGEPEKATKVSAGEALPQKTEPRGSVDRADAEIPKEPTSDALVAASDDAKEGPAERRSKDADSGAPNSSEGAGQGDVSPAEGAADKPVVAASEFEDMDASKLRCPTGMAKIPSRRKVTLPDGTIKRRRVVWCTDRYEFPGKGSLPTTNVTLAAAKQTCRARGRRLCRRSEWRGACGGAKYPYRGKYDPSRCNTVAPGGIPRSVVAAGSKRRCKGGFGTYDMSGNVAEWTSDGSVNGGSAQKDGSSATCYRSSRRTGGSPYVGFRCCADPIPIEPKTPKEGETP